MKLEDQVCSLELSKKLKSLGVKQESIFYWIQRKGAEPEVVYSGKPMTARDLFWPPIGSAFSVSELGGMLPQNVRHFSYGRDRCSEVPIAFPGKSLETNFPVMHAEAADTEASARAKMLIYLIEQGLVKV